MTIYHNTNSNAGLQAAAFSSDESGLTCAFHLDPEANPTGVKQMLANIDGVKLLAEAKNSGQLVVIAHSDQPEEQLLNQLQQHGETLELPVMKKKLEPWKWRGISSIVGQSLQLVSGLKGSKNPSDGMAIAGFAVTNLAANAVNIVFGKQEKKDPHHLHALKEYFNKAYQPHLAQGQALLDPDSNCLSQRIKAGEQDLSSRTYAMMKENSVIFSELGLRAIGAASLSFPITKWKGGMETLMHGGSGGEVLRSMANENPVTFKVGLITLFGKALVGISKESDPYNPKPRTLIDNIREKITFPLSSVVEGTGAAWMTHDRLKNQHFAIGGKTYPDYPGALGNAVFVSSYGFRLMAPYGTREVDMKELYAHLADGLAKMPHKQISQRVAETAAQLNAHFSDKDHEDTINVSAAFNALAAELKTYHYIDVMPPSPSSKKEPGHEEMHFAGKHATKKLPHSAHAPAGSHQEQLHESKLVANNALMP